MYEDKIIKLRDTEIFKEYERRLKIKLEKEKNKDKTSDKMWIWFKLLKMPEKYKRHLCENIEIEKMYFKENLNNLRKTNIDKESLNIINKYLSEFLNDEYKEKVENINNILIKENVQIINLDSINYPKCLKSLYDYPIMFFVKGNVELLKNRKIGIVGARDASIYGIKATRLISTKLYEKGYTIVSGLAKGVDKIAHIGSLKRTIAVLGTGHLKEVFYPKENIEIYEEILKNDGLIISEFLPYENGSKYTFPKRNRIIAALSESLIVTEAKIKSGSLITADFALELGKDIFTITGDIFSKNYDGNNNLIKDGAIPITDINDLDIYFDNVEEKYNIEKII